MKNSSACLATLFAFAAPGLVSGLEHASLEVVQLNATNNNQTHSSPSTLVTILPGGTPAMSIRGSNRGDIDIAFTTTPAQDHLKGVAITTVSENGRDNSSGGGPAGITYASSHAEISAAGFYIPTHALPGGAESGTNQEGGGEYNINVAAARFPFTEGWLTGYTTVSGTPAVTALTASPGITLGASGQVTETGTGITNINLSALLSHGVPATSSNGVLLNIGARNAASISMARDNADGSFTVSVMDNGPASPTTYIQDRFAFAYVPVAAAGKGFVKAVGRIRSDAQSEISGGAFAVAKQGTGQWLLTIPGETNATGTLIVTAEGGMPVSGTPNNTNNYVSYEWDATLGGWLIESRDLGLTTTALEDGATPDENMFSFVFLTQQPAIALTTPADEQVVSALRPLALAAAATSETPAPVQQMEFFVNGLPVGTDTIAPYQVPYTYPLPGHYDIEVRATLQGGAVVSSVQHKVRAEAYTAPAAMPGYSAGILDGGDLEVTDTNPANPVPNWAYDKNTASPFAFTSPGSASGAPAISVNGAAVPFNSGIILASNYAGGNWADTATRGSIDNISTVANDNGNYAFAMRDVVQVTPVVPDPALQPESGRTSIGYFPYANGWTGAHVNADGTVASSSNLPPDITITRPATGVYQISGLPVDGNLIAFTSGADSDNLACSTQRGLNWIVESRDNSQTLENSAFSFLFIPKESRQILSGKVAELGQLVPLNTGLETLGATCTKVGAEYRIQFGDGTIINPDTAALFVCSDTDAGPGDDNVHWYYKLDNSFVVMSQDMPNLSGGSQAGGFRFLATPFSPVQVHVDDVEIANVDSVAKERTADNTLQYRLTRFGDKDDALTVNYSVSGTSTNGADYQSLPLTATFAAGEATTLVTVNILDDTVFEIDETFIIELEPGTGYSVGIANTGSGEIYNADSIVPLTTVSFQEGVGGYTGTFAKSIGMDDNRGLEPAVYTDSSGESYTHSNGTEIVGQPILGMDGYPGHRHATDVTQDSPDVSVLLRFDEIFGNGPGQIPPGAKIAKAYLELTTHNGSNSQSGGPFVVDRLIEAVDNETTYAEVHSPDPGFEGVRNISTGYPVSAFGSIPINETSTGDVTEILRDWAENPAANPNYGFSIYTGGTTDGWTICSQSHSNIASRPRLVVTYTTEQTKSYTFTADKSSRIVGSGAGEVPSEDGSAMELGFIDLTTNGTTQEALLHFPVSFGDLAGQIPAGEEIVRAELVLSTGLPLEAGSTSAQSPGPIAIHRMLADWQVTTTFGTTGPRVGQEIGRVISTATGLGQGSAAYFDISELAQAWKHGQPNYGLNVKPQTEDGWQMYFPGTLSQDQAPYIRIVTVSSGTGGPSGFEEWASGNGVGGETQDSDTDKDGIVTLLEYALGLDPQAFNGLPQYQVASGTGSISFAKGAAAAVDPRVSYKIQSSTNLSVWTDETATADNSSVISLSAPVNSDKKFYRLVVSYSAF